MVSRVNKLTAKAIASFDKTGRFSDGGGLYLQVSKTGTKFWLFRFMLNGVSCEMGLGPVGDVTLAEARRVAHDCLALLREGIDPIEKRKAKGKAQFTHKAKPKTFEGCIKAYLKSHSVG